MEITLKPAEALLKLIKDDLQLQHEPTEEEVTEWIQKMIGDAIQRKAINRALNEE